MDTLVIGCYCLLLNNSIICISRWSVPSVCGFHLVMYLSHLWCIEWHYGHEWSLSTVHPYDLATILHLSIIRVCCSSAYIKLTAFNDQVNVSCQSPCHKNLPSVSWSLSDTGLSVGAKIAYISRKWYHDPCICWHNCFISKCGVSLPFIRPGRHLCMKGHGQALSCTSVSESLWTCSTESHTRSFKHSK